MRPRPCTSCPYRRDVPSGIWDPEEYAKLPGYDGDVPDQAAAGAFALFHCHQRDGNLCAGWAGCHDMTNSLAVRMNAERLGPGVYDYVSPVPLFASGAEAAEHGLRDVTEPSTSAVRAMRAIGQIRARSGT